MPGVNRVRLASMGLGLALALGLATAARVAGAAGSSGSAPVIDCKNRSFKVPFHVDDVDRPRLKEVQLFMSEDSGFTWKLAGRTTPDRPAFNFRASRDAEYWFAVRTLDTKGRLYPPDDKKLEPNMKVVVDTNPPSLVVEPQGRRGNRASVRWEVRDEHLDLPSFVIEYQEEGARDWKQVPIKRPSLIGEQTWDAGTADRLKVRASVADKAGNLQQVDLNLRDGTAANPDLASGGSDAADTTAPPPITSVSSGPNATGRDDPPHDGDAGRDDPPRDGGSGRDDPPPRDGGGAEGGGGGGGDHNDPFGPSPVQERTGPGPDAADDPFAASQPAPAAAPRPPAGARTLTVASPRFGLQYAVEDAGPNGPALVELWVTRDSGRTWARLPEDTDRTSPYPVDLTSQGGDGTFGLSLVVRSASGLGDQPPAPGDPPQMWVELDSTAPSVQLDPPRVGTGANMGKVAITWRATDAHLASRPIIISYRPEAPGSRWQPITDRLDNTGRFIWTVPTNAPPRFHLRVDAIDTLGNRGSAETTETGPVIVDRTRPRGRILGLDPSARNGPSARPLR